MPNPNVLFKRGTQANFNANISSTAQDGVFYLTEDTHRLYVGINSTPYLLNQTVNIIASLSELEETSNSWTAQQKIDHVNDFYYLTAENILAVWMYDTKTSMYKWVQINPDSNNINSTLEYNINATGNIGVVNAELTDNKGHSITANFAVEVAGGLKIASATAQTGLLITGSEYSVSRDVSSNNATITLGNSANSTTSGYVLRGGNNITISSTGTNGIAIEAKDSYINSSSATVNNGVLTIEVSDTEGHSTSASTSQIGIVLNDGSYAALASVSSGAAGAIYSKNEIDTKLNGLNGMSYVGTIGNASQNPSVTALPTISGNVDIHNGDVYVVVSDGFAATADIGTVPASGAVVGDMFIAKGTETNGKITSNLEWTYIPSGNDSLDAVNYAAEVTTATNSIEVNNGIGTQLFGLTLQSSTGINVVSSSTSGTYMTSVISHADYSTTSTTSSAVSTTSFAAISGLTINNGHITGYNIETFTPETYTFEDNDISSTTANSYVVNGTRSTTANLANDLTIAHTLKTSGGSLVGSSLVKLSSSSIQLSKGNDGEVVMDMMWGSF